MNEPIQQIVLPKWRMNEDQTYDMINKKEVMSCKFIKEKKDEDDLNSNFYLPFAQTVLSAFRNLTINYHSSDIELTASEVFSICVGVKYRSSLGVIHTIKPTPTYFRKVEAALLKYCILSGQRFILPSILNQNEEITQYEQINKRLTRSSSKKMAKS